MRHPATYLLFFTLILLPLSSKQEQCSNCYNSYSNARYNYHVLLPKGWEKSVMDLGYKHVILLNKGRYTEIKVSAMKPDKDDLKKWEDWSEWYIKGVGKRLLRIIETKNILIEKDIVGKVILFGYLDHHGNALQRVLIAKYLDNLIIIECKATLAYFKKYTETFNVVMGSLRIPAKSQ